MKVTGKHVPTSVGVFFIVFALIAAVIVSAGAKESQSPLLYVCIFGGLFVAIPVCVGVGVILENLRTRN